MQTQLSSDWFDHDWIETRHKCDLEIVPQEIWCHAVRESEINNQSDPESRIDMDAILYSASKFHLQHCLFDQFESNQFSGAHLG